MKVKGIFYLKSGVTIEEYIETSEDNEKQRNELKTSIDNIRELIRDWFKGGTNGSISYGYTIVALSDLSAVKFIEV